jgi:uncharacterized protein YjbI with pentapeptide repeats
MLGKTLEYKTIDQHAFDEACRAHRSYLTGRMGGARANFSYTVFNGIDLSGRDLTDAEMSGAILAEANLSGTNLTGANLFAADLRGCRLTGANLHRADLRGVVMRGADLTGAILTEADVREGSIARVDKEKGLALITHELRPGELSHVKFAGANLSRTKMHSTIAQAADFTNAVLIGSQISRANLRSACFNGANLEGADLQGADLSGADLSDSVLIGTNLQHAQLDKAKMQGVLRDEQPGDVFDPEGETAKDLEAHAAWCESDGQRGKPSSFDGKDLRGFESLSRRNLTALVARNAVFYGMNLEFAQLQGAKLAGADLRRVNLRGADLRGADLTGAKLTNADLRKANLGPLTLINDRVLPTNLSGALLSYADLTGADIENARFNGADCCHARLHTLQAAQSDFTDAMMFGATRSSKFDSEANGLPPQSSSSAA